MSTNVSIPAELIPAVGFLAQHFSDDITNSQAGPYEYSDQERDACMAVIEWTWRAAKEAGCSSCDLGIGETNASATYHQADELAEDKRQPWPNAINSEEA